MNRTELKKLMTGFEYDMRLTDILVSIARHDMEKAIDMLSSMTDEQIARCYLTSYDFFTDQDVNNMVDEMTINTKVAKLCRKLILDCKEGKASLMAQCPICGGILMPHNDDDGKIFLECHGSDGIECHLSICEDPDDRDGGFARLFEKAAAFTVRPMRTGIISVACPSCGAEINVTEKERHHVICGACGSRYPMRIASMASNA